MKFKIIINSLFILFSTIIIAFLLSQLVSKTTTESAAKIIWTVNNLKPNSVDVVIVGPSPSRYGYNSLVAWNRYGITTLNCSFGYLAGPLVKNMLIECLKRQKPKVILITVDSFLFNNMGILLKNGTYVGLNNLSFDIFPEIKWSLNKIDFLKNVIKYYNLDIKDTIHFLFPITSTHKISITGITNFKKDLYFACKYKNYFSGNNISFNLKNLKSYQKYNGAEFYTKESLEDLFVFCKNLDIPVIFIDVPHTVTFTKPYYMNNEKYEKIFSFVKENNFDFIYINNYRTIRDLKLSYYDSYDNSHLNYWGSIKYTDYVAKILVDKYHLEDKRNNPDYSFWNDAAKQYIKDIKDNFDVDISL
ncbi:hypothetical protein [Candidatus Ruminimicrobiellum ovillum]|uniref:hypothetical protein n=1 Tax=Candidatus Ruminimicrobiellum ovillum TaxID=1947927 RepID=UPI003559F427